jgi:hypothetical protein
MMRYVENSSVIQEGVFRVLWNSRLTKKKLLVDQWEAELADDPERLKKLLPRAREDTRLIVQELVALTSAIKKKYPSWDGTFLTPPNEKEKKTDPAKDEAEDADEPADDIQSESFALTEEQRKIKSWLVRWTMPRNAWRLYFYTEKSPVKKIIADLKAGRVKNIDEYFPPDQRKKINYHEALMKDAPTIRRRMSTLLDNVESLVTSLDNDFGSDDYTQTREFVFAWAYRGFETFPSYERMVITLLNRYK